MSVEFKDYYAILGVPRGASDVDIKKAFRQLARKHHPDVARDKKASEAKFKEINEAYEVLGDPAKRKRYDQLGTDWQNGPPPPRRGRRRHAPNAEDFHFGGTGFSDFFERFFGGGAGFDRSDFDPAAAPGGAGRAVRGADIEGDILVTLDECLNGGLRTLSLQHRGRGEQNAQTESFTVRIPPGALDGQRIRVPGKGAQSHAGGPPGDLFLRVRVAAHPDFRFQGADLYHDLELAPWDAVLGTSLKVPTLGGSIQLRIPACTESGRQLRVRGHGLPKGRTGERGDLYVSVHISIPKDVTPTERAAWEHLRDVSSATTSSS